MEKRYYLLDSQIVTQAFKEKKPVTLDDVDPNKYLICRESSLVDVAYSQYGVQDDISKILYTKMPLSMETSTDDLLNVLKYLSDLVGVYKLVDYKKEYSAGMVYYIISVNEVDDAL